MTTKEELHQLIDELPESEWHAALRFLEYLRGEARPWEEVRKECLRLSPAFPDEA